MCQVLFYPLRVSGEGFRGQRADTVNSLFGEEQSVYVTAAVYKSGIFPLLHLQILERRDHTCFHCLSLDSRYLSIASFSTTGARYLRTNHTPSCLSLLPSFILFSFVFGHDHQHLAAAPRHQYALNMVLTLFLSILLTLFLTFSCSSGATTTRIPSP